MSTMQISIWSYISLKSYFLNAFLTFAGDVLFPFPLYRTPTALSGKPVQLGVRYCCFVHLSGKLNYRFMSMVQRVFAKFISVIKFYHWRQNVHMPFNFHNIFAHHTHTQLHCTSLPTYLPLPPLGQPNPQWSLSA